MKSVLISIQPKWCEKIANGEKTIEVRKTRPKLETPFKCYIYCTNTPKYHHLYDLTRYNNGETLLSVTEHNKYSLVPKGYLNGKVIGDFVCDWITEITPSCDIDGCVNQYIHGYPAILADFDCLSFDKMKGYLGNKKGYDWHISDLKIYDKPKLIMQFYKPCPIKLGFKNCPVCELYSTYTGYCMNNIDRPPQSWCYVDELE